MKAFVFPGQGAQFSGMGKHLYDNNKLAKELFEKANDLLGFRISDIMFNGTEEDLKQTKVTQPAIFLHSTILSASLKDFCKPDMVAGHSLGEFSALVANKCLSFEDGLQLVYKRAIAMQEACEKTSSTMAAVIGLSDEKVIDIVRRVTSEIVVAANFNAPDQVVISGSIRGIEEASEILKVSGARRVLPLKVGGAFHSPFMESAYCELKKAIEKVNFFTPICPIYQNYTAQPSCNTVEIKKNLIAQLISPVLWTQTVRNMVANGATHFTEIGPGNVLQGLIKKIAQVETAGINENNNIQN
ncbi:MAG: ACP S-malonyltransferase [Bacteroidales bacterium]|jgi:[acyl-carrier-protein] S-malonyltransferase|nr:ACP S-malonyltransferase [Bacteroidales bacterium]